MATVQVGEDPPVLVGQRAAMPVPNPAKSPNPTDVILPDSGRGPRIVAYGAGSPERGQ